MIYKIQFADGRFSEVEADDIRRNGIFLEFLKDKKLVAGFSINIINNYFVK